MWNLEENMPSPIRRNVSLIQYRDAALRRNFPSTFVDVAAAAQTQQMGAMAAAQDEANKISRAQLEFHKKQKVAGKLERVRRVCEDGQQTSLLDAPGKSSLADLPE